MANERERRHSTLTLLEDVLKRFTSPFPAHRLLFILIACFGCVQQQQPEPVAQKELTAGVVQKEIRKGMSQAEVAEALGSPNIVTRDNDGLETWIYDRIATVSNYESTDSNFGAGGTAGAVRGSSLLIGLLSGSIASSSGYRTTGQRTFTVILKFARDSRLDRFSFHQSTF